MFYGQRASVIIQVGSSGKEHIVLVEVINGRTLLSGPVIYETKPLDVTISSHTSKVVFSVIFFFLNLIIIRLS